MNFEKNPLWRGAKKRVAFLLFAFLIIFSPPALPQDPQTNDSESGLIIKNIHTAEGNLFLPGQTGSGGPWLFVGDDLADLGTGSTIASGTISVATIPSGIVNVPDMPVVTIGVSELKDVAALYFCIYEAYLKASADNEVNMSDIQYLLPPAMALVPAFSGATQIINELKSLTDDQIKTLLLVAEDYQLGSHAQRAKQVFKTILTLAQTYFVFEAAAASQ
jgi:hypothetical protein